MQIDDNNFNLKSIVDNIDLHDHLSSDKSLVILGDSLEVLKKFKDNSVDLIFTDPPYGIRKDFGDDSDFFNSVEEYFNWCKLWIDECMRILKKDGTMYFMSATQHMPFLDVYVSQKYHVINRIVWAYDSSGVQSKKKFGSLFEPIIMITHNKKSKYTFNYKDILVDAKTGSERGLIDYRKTPPQPHSNQLMYNLHESSSHLLLFFVLQWNTHRVGFQKRIYSKQQLS